MNIGIELKHPMDHCSLPLDCIGVIAEHLDPSSLINLMTCCRDLYEFLAKGGKYSKFLEDFQKRKFINSLVLTLSSKIDQIGFQFQIKQIKTFHIGHDATNQRWYYIGINRSAYCEKQTALDFMHNYLKDNFDSWSLVCYKRIRLTKLFTEYKMLKSYLPSALGTNANIMCWLTGRTCDISLNEFGVPTVACKRRNNKFCLSFASRHGHIWSFIYGSNGLERCKMP